MFQCTLFKCDLKTPYSGARTWLWAQLLLLLMCGGCATLPNLDTRPASREAARALRAMSAMPRIDGARGPLSAQQAKVIMDRLRNEASTNFLDLHVAVEESMVGSPLTAGNRVKLLHDGPATYQAMIAAITAARQHINMETYIFDDDEVGQRFVAALIAKQREGVQVTVIRDSVGTLSTPTEFFTEMTAAGIKVLEFNPVNPLTSKAGWSLNQRDHRKLLIVDGRIAFMGGINISSVYSSGSFRRAKLKPDTLPWRDTDVQVEGPVVLELQKLFLETWTQQQGEALATDTWFPQAQTLGREVVRAVGSSPEDPYSFIYATLISAFRSAQSHIWLTNAYFVPDPQLVEALEQATARGVDVRLILPSRTDSWLVLQASRAHYTRLLKAGVRIYLRRDALLHVKTALVDGVWSTVGSTNLDWRSFLHNQELNVIVLGDDFGNQMREAFLKDAAQSDEITLKSWRTRPVSARFSELFGRIWQYWL